MTFNAKNLSYESNEPAFLRKLRSEYGGEQSGRHERLLARPKKLRDPNDLDDDAPTYVDEQSHDVVTKETYEALLRKDRAEISNKLALSEEQPGKDGTHNETSDDITAKPLTVKAHAASIGGSTKKRRAKVVGENDESSETRDEQTEGKMPEKPKQAKKNKKIKLSFDSVE